MEEDHAQSLVTWSFMQGLTSWGLNDHYTIKELA